MVEPFERAKKQWHSWIDNHVDHAFQVSDRDPLIEVFARIEPEILPRLMVMPGDPTTELLAACFMAKLNAFLAADGGRLTCVEVSDRGNADQHRRLRRRSRPGHSGRNRRR